ncbi:MAG: putative toxin-antitoxin system toxin component, PIN family [Clostridia bacterium]|nr:MAG: putative toxin-antitoxin system toxin component, PIN family [Clostridia bacterium]
MKRVVMDTNSLVSAIGWEGPPHRILQACLRGQLELYVSPAILRELTEVLARPKLRVVAEHPDLTIVLSWLYQPVRLVIPRIELSVVEDDPDDNRVVECAVEAGAEAVVTGDTHLLHLGHYQEIVFLRPHEACSRWGF